MKVSKFHDQVVSYDDRRWFQLSLGKRGGIEVRVNDKWWMPPKPFPLGFDQRSAEFDTVDNAVNALKEILGFGRFVELNQDGEIVRTHTMHEYIRHAKINLGLQDARD